MLICAVSAMVKTSRPEVSVTPRANDSVGAAGVGHPGDVVHLELGRDPARGDGLGLAAHAALLLARQAREERLDRVLHGVAARDALPASP